MSEKKELDWIGVDLDGTLAKFPDHFSKEYTVEGVGEPIPNMINRVKQWVNNGSRVKIFTARMSPTTAIYYDTPLDVIENAIHLWLIEHLGFDLEVTHEKDMFMIELWDDISLIQVHRNTGGIVNNID